eukprot:6187220-Pleurochrysis_carterae.AAC.3
MIADRDQGHYIYNFRIEKNGAVDGAEGEWAQWITIHKHEAGINWLVELEKLEHWHGPLGTAH